MASKRAPIDEPVKATSAERALPRKTDKETTEGTQWATEDHNGPRKGHKGPRGEPVKVRLSAADLAALDAIADREGSNRSILIRRAVKELIRRGGR